MIGLDYPLRRGRDGYFDRTDTDLEQVRVNLFNLLSTRKGERLMKPEFGTNLHTLTYSNQTERTRDRIEEEIRSATERWMSYLTIENLQVNFVTSGVEVQLKFTTDFTPGTSEFMQIFLEEEE
jgi:hypothetical protein